MGGVRELGDDLNAFLFFLFIFFLLFTSKPVIEISASFLHF
jgi:hypothetical protein